MLSMAKKAEIFEAKLSQQDLNTLAYIVKLDRDKEVNARVDKEVYTINQALQTSISAALFDFTKLSTSEVEEILTRCNEYMKGAEEFLIKYREDWIMKINEIKPQIKEESLKLLDAKKNQQQSVKALGEKFKDIPTKDLVNIFKEAKEEWCKKCAELTEEDKKVISEQGAVPHPGNKVKSKAEKVSQPITPEKGNENNMETIDNQNEVKNNIFNLKKKKLEFSGIYYEYEKDEKGLKVGNELFESLDKIKEYENNELEQMKKQMAEFCLKMEEVKMAFNYKG